MTFQGPRILYGPIPSDELHSFLTFQDQSIACKIFIGKLIHLYGLPSDLARSITLDSINLKATIGQSLTPILANHPEYFV
jgi:hypothetical protein